MASVLVCVLVVGSCIAIVAWLSLKDAESATPRARHARGPAVAPAPSPAALAAEPAVPAPPAEHGSGAPGTNGAAARPVEAVALEVPAPADPSPPVAAPVDTVPEAMVRAPAPDAPLLGPRRARRAAQASVLELEPPRRRPTPAEAARRSRPSGGERVATVPWWHKARAAIALGVLSVVLGLLAAAALGAVVFVLYTVLRSALG